MRVPKLDLQFVKKLWSKTSRSHRHGDAAAEEDHHQYSSKKSEKKKTPAKVAPPIQPPPPEECPICHDPVGLENPEGIVESWTALHCGHKFGTHCIQTWLHESIARDHNVNPTCPVCRSTAKHPCGHLVSPPMFPPVQYVGWHESPVAIEDTEATAATMAPPRRRRMRRRLTRRPGHPSRRQLQSPKRKVQTIGQCRTCVENAEFEARMQRLAEQQRRIQQQQRRQTGDSTLSSGSRSGGIKSMIPGLKRSSNTVRTTVFSVYDPYMQRQRENFDDYCAVRNAAAVPRSPTPGPAPGYGYSRRLSI